MSATIIAFPTAERLAEVEQERDNPLERAIDTGRAIAAASIAGASAVELGGRLDHLRRMIGRLELSHAEVMDDEAIIAFGPATIYWPLRTLPEMLAGMLGGARAA
jgi:hypothetical protein